MSESETVTSPDLDRRDRKLVDQVEIDMADECVRHIEAMKALIRERAKIKARIRQRRFRKAKA